MPGFFCVRVFLKNLQIEADFLRGVFLYIDRFFVFLIAAICRGLRRLSMVGLWLLRKLTTAVIRRTICCALVSLCIEITMGERSVRSERR
jgi:hypothetical protein